MRQYFKVLKTLCFDPKINQILIEVQIEFSSHNFQSTFAANQPLDSVYSVKLNDFDSFVDVLGPRCVWHTGVCGATTTMMMQTVVVTLDTSTRMESLSESAPNSTDIYC